MTDFDDIRPYLDHEVPDALHRLLRDTEFLDFISRHLVPRMRKLAPGLARFLVSRFLISRTDGIRDVNSLQRYEAHYARSLVDRTTTSLTVSGLDQLPLDRPCLYISNHRDIAGDSMILNYVLHQAGLDTVHIAVGDNLVQRRFATDLMRLNKSFFIKRSEEGPRKIYAAMKQSSAYIKQSLCEGHSIWIAQSEGRAKDGLDTTDPAVIKMFRLAHNKRPWVELLPEVNLVPLAISYEYDPCDMMKARELYEIDTNGHYEKPPNEDLIALATGLGGVKGRVHVAFGSPITGDLNPDEIAAEVDRQVVSGLKAYPINHWAFSTLATQYGGEYADLLPAIEKSEMSSDLLLHGESDIASSDRHDQCPEPHRPFWLAAYGNLLLNKGRQGLLGT